MPLKDELKIPANDVNAGFDGEKKIEIKLVEK